MGETQISSARAFALHFLCAVALAACYCLARDIYALSLVSHPAQTLRLLLVFEGPVVIGIYSWIRHDPDRCSYFKAVGRGLLGLPIGTFRRNSQGQRFLILDDIISQWEASDGNSCMESKSMCSEKDEQRASINAFGAIVLGAPVGINYLTRTIYWSLLMSLFTFVPAACIFGKSRMDWQHIISYSKPMEGVDYMISLPAHGAVIGAWLGAWPMPLDWERPWQEWPICVTYGSVAGYLVGMLASSVLILVLRRKVPVKVD